MLIGVDLDNTLVCYDQLFHKVALERELVPPDLPAVKDEVRDYLREQGREAVWTELQGYVYGPRMCDAQPFPGVHDFFLRCKAEGVPVAIISHRTRSPFRGPAYDLHESAQEWLEKHGLCGPSSKVFFELTKQDKLDRIAVEGCTHFIDDLPEFLSEPGFPPLVQRILFDPSRTHMKGWLFRSCHSWDEIERLLWM